MRENVIEWVQGGKMASITAPAGSRLGNRLIGLLESHPEEVDIITNADGSVFGHVPAKWVKINPTKQLGEEQLEQMRARLARSREMKLSDN